MNWKRLLLFGGLGLSVTLTLAVVAAMAWLTWLFWPNTRVFVAGNVRLDARLDAHPRGFRFALIGTRSIPLDPSMGLSVRSGESQIDFDASFSEQGLPSGEPSRAYDLDPSVTGWPPGARQLFLFDGAVEAVVAEGSVRQVCIRSDLSPQGLEVRTALSGEWIRFPLQEADAAKLFGTPLHVFNAFRK
jgi:hypothetical protein